MIPQSANATQYQNRFGTALLDQAFSFARQVNTIWSIVDARNEKAKYIHEHPSVAVAVVPAIAEFDRVMLKVHLSHGENTFTPHTIGTVVYVHGDGKAFEVEFNDPVFDVITLEARDVVRLHG